MIGVWSVKKNNVSFYFQLYKVQLVYDTKMISKMKDCDGL